MAAEHQLFGAMGMVSAEFLQWRIQELMAEYLGKGDSEKTFL